MWKSGVVSCLFLLGCSTAAGRVAVVESERRRCGGSPGAGAAIVSAAALRQNFGGQPILRAGGNDEALLQFSLAAIPPSAAIDTATLKLYVSGRGGDQPI